MSDSYIKEAFDRTCRDAKPAKAHFVTIEDEAGSEECRGPRNYE